MSKPNILVPYDFTVEAKCALEHAIALATLEHGKVILNHIIDKRSMAALKHDGKSIFDLQAEFNSLADASSTAAVKVTAILREGDIFTGIPECAKEADADLIIFGTHGVHGMQHLLGAFAMRLVTSADVPVIIVQRRTMRPAGYKKIVYPVDENPYSKQKAYAVAEFAKRYNAEVLLFPKQNGDEHFQNYTNGNLIYSEKVFEEAGIKYHMEANHKHGSFSKIVMEFAASNDADLIAITTQDSEDRDLGDIFVGSEDVRIINNAAEIPTLCINAVVSLKVGGLNSVTSLE